MHQWSIFIFFQDLLLQIRLNLETSRSKRVKVPTTNQFLKHAPRASYTHQIQCVFTTNFSLSKIVFAIYRWSTSDNNEHLRRLCCVICQSSIMFAWKFLHLPMYMYFLTWQIKFIYSRNIQTLYNAIWNTGALINV